MNKKTIITFGLFFISIVSNSCKDKLNARLEVSTLAPSNCFSKSEKEKIITTILETPDFQMFLHPTVKGRIPVQLVKNEFVTPDLEIESNGYKVVFKDSLILPEGTVHWIRFSDEDCSNKKVSYSIFYPVEGAILNGTVVKLDTLWLVENSNWGIKD
jgi:hypothetical protein